MRTLLMVAYYFPPLGGIASLRALGFAEHLPEFGWEPVVLAPSNGAYLRDPSLAYRRDRVVRAWSPELSRAGKRILYTGGDDVRPATVGAVRALARGLARRWLYFPDAHIGWYPAAVVRGSRMAARRSFHAIFSSSFPITAHVVARTLHRRTGIPWVAEFRDPWSDRRRNAGRLERALADEASALVMPSPSWSVAHAERWGRTVLTIPNGCEPTPLAAPPRGELIACYLGSYYPGRQDLSAAWAALARMAASGTVSRVRLRIVGEMTGVMRAELHRHGLEPLLETTGFLPHREALRQIAGASVLLAAGGEADAAGAGWIPAKLFDYLQSGVPIVWVGKPSDDAAALLALHEGCHIVGRGDVDGVVSAFEASLGMRYERELSGITRRDRAQQLAKVLDTHSVRGAGGPLPTLSLSR